MKGKFGKTSKSLKILWNWLWVAFKSFWQILLENNITLQSPPRELNMQSINNNFYREQIQILTMLTEKEAQWLASAEEDKSLQINNSGKTTENILLSFSATDTLVCNADLTRTNIYSQLLLFLVRYLLCFDSCTQHINMMLWWHNYNSNFMRPWSLWKMLFIGKNK